MSLFAFSYAPNNWYWKADDGRIFGSAKLAIVQEDDEDYQVWLERGWPPTPWPSNDEGEQTKATLQDVLTPWGIVIP